MELLQVDNAFAKCGYEEKETEERRVEGKFDRDSQLPKQDLLSSLRDDQLFRWAHDHLDYNKVYIFYSLVPKCGQWDISRNVVRWHRTYFLKGYLICTFCLSLTLLPLCCLEYEYNGLHFILDPEEEDHTLGMAAQKAGRKKSESLKTVQLSHQSWIALLMSFA